MSSQAASLISPAGLAALCCDSFPALFRFFFPFHFHSFGTSCVQGLVIKCHFVPGTVLDCSGAAMNKKEMSLPL